MSSEITCQNCSNCYLPTLVCQVYNKSIADNSVHPWECEKFKSRKPYLRLILDMPKSEEVEFCGCSQFNQKILLDFKEREKAKKYEF